MRLFLLIFFTISSFAALSQQKSTISGYLTDSKSGEALIGAKVYIPSLKVGAETNTYGFYSLTVEKGTYTIEFRFTGLETLTKEFDLNQDVSFNYEMGTTEKQL